MIWPIIYLVATVFITIVPMIAKPAETGFGCLIIATGAPVYFIFCAWKNKPKYIQKFFCKYSANSSHVPPLSSSQRPVMADLLNAKQLIDFSTQTTSP